MTMRKALDEAMHHETVDGAMDALGERGMSIVDEDTMTQAVHDVFCGIMADHAHPSDKDRDQARQLIAAVGGAATGSAAPDAG
jgi:hypothetical protein